MLTQWRLATRAARHRHARLPHLPHLPHPSHPSHPKHTRGLRVNMHKPGTSSTSRKTIGTGETVFMSVTGLAVLGLLFADDIESLVPALRLDAATDKTTQRDWAVGQTDKTDTDKSDTTDSLLPELNVKSWFSDMGTVDWNAFSDRLTDLLLPEWTRYLPGFVRKLQRELDHAPGSLADEIWRDAHDPDVHPEIQYAARVRVSDDLCSEEQAFRQRRKTVTAAALARYLGLREQDVHPDDVPVIALCGSGGGLRALVAGTGSLMAAQESGLFDCATYTAGVSGSCWLQALFFSSFSHQSYEGIAAHLRTRLGIHIADPPEAIRLLTTAPTNKYLLSGAVERHKADPDASFGLVDIYGTLLAARLLVPRGELGVSPLDYKLSSQRRHLARGENPMPIYTAVRHEIPELDADAETETEKKASESGKAEAKQEAWFQWFEISPYEFFCEEFSAGIPTWALGRQFQGGRDVPMPPVHADTDDDDDADAHYRQPEVRLPLMLGVFGSAFCATLSHYYKEIRPVVQGLAGLGGLDQLIWGRNEDLSKVHPIEPATLPNPVYGMDPASLPASVPPGLLQRKDLQLMDAGMSNNLPLYPFMRPGRGVEVIVVFDASADIRQDNWLNVADGYARKRGVQGWPVGVGWPAPDEAPADVVEDLKAADASDNGSANAKLAQAQAESRDAHDAPSNGNSTDSTDGSPEADAANRTARDLGYCTVWVGSAAEEVSTAKDASARAPRIDESTQWRLSSRDAGLTLVYMPYLANEARVPGVNPATSDFMSTWNFVYTPAEVDSAVALAKANFDEGAAQIRATIRAVYERKRQIRLERQRSF